MKETNEKHSGGNTTKTEEYNLEELEVKLRKEYNSDKFWGIIIFMIILIICLTIYLRNCGC